MRCAIFVVLFNFLNSSCTEDSIPQAVQHSTVTVHFVFHIVPFRSLTSICPLHFALPNVKSSKKAAHFTASTVSSGLSEDNCILYPIPLAVRKSTVTVDLATFTIHSPFQDSNSTERNGYCTNVRAGTYCSTNVYPCTQAAAFSNFLDSICTVHCILIAVQNNKLVVHSVMISILSMFLDSKKLI